MPCLAGEICDGGTICIPGPRFNRFVDNDEPDQPMVEDTDTGLVWQGYKGYDCNLYDSSAHRLQEWQLASSYCEGLLWGTYTDWRFPDIGELTSITDSGAPVPPYIDAVSFPNPPSPAEFWSSSFAGHGGAYYYYDYDDNRRRAATPDKEFNVRCVRGDPPQ